uniref:LigA n=1 Tax=Macrostomum lignano TaxID=282301 RepID=A0A1I8FTB4_9PLAT
DFFSLQGDVHTSAAVGQNITQAAGRLAEFGRHVRNVRGVAPSIGRVDCLVTFFDPGGGRRWRLGAVLRLLDGVTGPLSANWAGRTLRRAGRPLILGRAAPSGDIGAAAPGPCDRRAASEPASGAGWHPSGTTAVVSPSARSAAGRRGDARGCRSTALANPCGGDRRLLAFGRAVDGPNSRSHNALATALGAISAASQLLMLVVLNAYLLILNYLSP